MSFPKLFSQIAQVVQQQDVCPKVKYNSRLFERPFKENKNGVFFSFFFFLLEYLLLFQRYSGFCSKTDDVTDRLSTKIAHKYLGNYWSGASEIWQSPIM